MILTDHESEEPETVIEGGCWSVYIPLPAKVMAVGFWDVMSASWWIHTNKKTFMKAKHHGYKFY